MTRIVSLRLGKYMPQELPQQFTSVIRTGVIRRLPPGRSVALPRGNALAAASIQSTKMVILRFPKHEPGAVFAHLLIAGEMPDKG